MLTGYNTDVRHDDVVYHVQTEDKGTENPFIESLIYVGGQVLAARRESYADLLEDGLDPKAVSQRMDHQHRVVIAAIKSGKFDDKLRALLGKREARAKAPVEAFPRVPEPPTAQEPREEAPATEESRQEGPAARERDAREPSQGSPASPESVLPTEPEPAARRSLDEVILEYLSSEAEREHLVLRYREEPKLALGKPATLHLETTSSRSGDPVVGTQVVVKMVSTVLDSLVLARGRTDEEGRLTLSLRIPELRQGTAAVVVSATSLLGNAELKQVL